MRGQGNGESIAGLDRGPNKQRPGARRCRRRGGAPTASSRIDIGHSTLTYNGDGVRVQNAQSFGWRIGYDWQPRVAYFESDDEYGEDEDAEWQGRSPLYPHVAWERRERRAHVTNLLGGQWQLHTNDVMGNWN